MSLALAQDSLISGDLISGDVTHKVTYTCTHYMTPTAERQRKEKLLRFVCVHVDILTSACLDVMREHSQQPRLHVLPLCSCKRRCRYKGCQLGDEEGSGNERRLPVSACVCGEQP